MPLCAFLWAFGAVALCHAWSPALSSRVLKLGGLVMFREKEKERERKCSVVHIVCSFSQLEFQPLPACLCSSLLKYLCLCCRHVCFHHGCICLSQYSIQSLPSTFQSDWLKCCRMLPWCPVLCQYFVQHCTDICAAESIILIYRFSLSTFVESHFNWNLLLTLLQSALGYSFFCCWKFCLTLVVIPFSHKPKCLQSYWQRASAYRCESKGSCRLQSFHQGSRQWCTERLSQRAKWVRLLCSLHHSSSCIFRMISFVWVLCLHSHTRMMRH